MPVCRVLKRTWREGRQPESQIHALFPLQVEPPRCLFMDVASCLILEASIAPILLTFPFLIFVLFGFFLFLFPHLFAPGLQQPSNPIPT